MKSKLSVISYAIDTKLFGNLAHQLQIVFDKTIEYKRKW